MFVNVYSRISNSWGVLARAEVFQEINIDVSMRWVYGPCFTIIVPSVFHIRPIEQLFSVQNCSVNCCFMKIVEKESFQNVCQ